jgi:outer membrane lipoprotein-sorting protein
MAGLGPATQRARVCGRRLVFSLADARWLGGRVKPGHGDFGVLLSAAMRFYGTAMRRIVLFFCLLATAPAAAATLSDADKADLDRVSAYLNSIHTMRGSFLQVGPEGDVAQGQFFLVKPGRIRFQYDPPAPMLIVSDGRTVAVQNLKLNTVDRYPISQTPLDLISGDDIDLRHNSDITGVIHQQDALIVKAHSGNFGVHADIAFTFAEPTLELRQWVVVDNQGLATTLALRNAQIGVEIPPSEFILPRPSLFH